MKDAIKRVPGVGDVIIFGERKYAMRIWLDPLRSGSAGPDCDRRGQRAAGAEREIPAGQLGQPPADSSRLPDPRARGGPAHDPAQFDNIILKNIANGLVLLKDVGHAEVGAEDYSSS